MSGFVKPMQLYPELRRDFIGKGLKRFLFCLIVILHVGIFVLPALWYFFRQWLKPEEEVTSVALVDAPSSDSNPGGGRACKGCFAKQVVVFFRTVSAADP